jgi:hypothetical protein
MPAVIVHSSGSRDRRPLSDPHLIDRSMHGAYARQRIEEVIQAVLEDALSPARLDAPPWHDDAAFEAELAAAVRDITDATTDLVAESLAMLLETAPPRLAMRFAAAPRLLDHA